MSRPQEFNTDQALQKALGVFWRKGFEATTLFDLLNATGLSKSSLYGTFGGKRELFIAAFDAYREERVREMKQIVSHGPARRAIEKFFRKIIADAGSAEFSHGCMSTNQAIELAPHDREIRGRVGADFQLIEDTLARAIKRGQADGSVKSVRSARELARLFVVTFPGFQVMVRAGSNKTRLDEALKVLMSNLD